MVHSLEKGEGVLHKWLIKGVARQSCKLGWGIAKELL